MEKFVKLSKHLKQAEINGNWVNFDTKRGWLQFFMSALMPEVYIIDKVEYIS